MQASCHANLRRAIGMDMIYVFDFLLNIQREAFAAAGGGPRSRGRPEADPEGMAACGQSLEGFAQMQCWARSKSGSDRVAVMLNGYGSVLWLFIVM